MQQKPVQVNVLGGIIVWPPRTTKAPQVFYCVIKTCLKLLEVLNQLSEKTWSLYCGFHDSLV